MQLVLHKSVCLRGSTCRAGELARMRVLDPQLASASRVRRSTLALRPWDATRYSSGACSPASVADHVHERMAMLRVHTRNSWALVAHRLLRIDTKDRETMG
jgi:hypothetical protein